VYHPGAISIFTGNVTNGWALQDSITGNRVICKQEFIGKSLAINSNGTILAFNQGLSGVSIFTGSAVNKWAHCQTILIPPDGWNMQSDASALVPNWNSLGRYDYEGGQNQLCLTMNSDGTSIALGMYAGEYNFFAGDSLHYPVTGRTPSGKAYIFKGNPISKWQLTKTITGNNGLGRQFATSLALSDNPEIVVVGSPGPGLEHSAIDYDNQPVSGYARAAAYIYPV
jgi:hypothetical protein